MLLRSGLGNKKKSCAISPVICGTSCAILCALQSPCPIAELSQPFPFSQHYHLERSAYLAFHGRGGVLHFDQSLYTSILFFSVYIYHPDFGCRNSSLGFPLAVAGLERHCQPSLTVHHHESTTAMHSTPILQVTITYDANSL